MLCCASTAITPAVTLDSTASINALRVSSCVLAVRSSFVCTSSRSVIWLKAVESVCTSSSLFGDRYAGGKVAGFDPTRGIDELPDRPDQPVRELERGQDGQADDDEGAEEERRVEAKLVNSRAREQCPVILEGRHLHRSSVLELGIEHA